VGAGHGRSGGEGDEAHGRTDIRDIADFSMQIAWWISRIRVGTAPNYVFANPDPFGPARVVGSIRIYAFDIGSSG
jgi:hypothetical protein